MNNPKTDIVLVNPPSSMKEEFGALKSAGGIRPPLNLLNIGAILLKEGFSVKLFDAAAKGLGVSLLVEEIIKTNCDIVGITSMTANIDISSQVALQLKKINPNITVIIGGAHVSAMKERVFEEFPSFDIGVYGEGDRTVVELMRNLKEEKDSSRLKAIDGILYRENGSIIRTSPRQLIEDLDSLPMPAWNLLEDYATIYSPVVSRKSGGKSAYIITSRGCPFKCTFCFSVSGSKPRFFSLNYIFKLIDWHVENDQITDLTVFDENLLFSRKRINEFCDRLIEGNYNLTWSCSARANCVDRMILEKMYKAGCRSIFFGIESGNAQILARYKKGLNHELIENAVNDAKAAKLKVTGSFIIGGPMETVKTIRDTIRFALKLPLDYATPFYYTPLPGTADYPDISKFGEADLSYSSARMSKPNFVPNEMSEKQVVRLYKEFLLRFYARPSKLSMLMKEMGVSKFLRSGISFVGSLLSN